MQNVCFQTADDHGQCGLQESHQHLGESSLWVGPGFPGFGLPVERPHDMFLGQLQLCATLS